MCRCTNGVRAQHTTDWVLWSGVFLETFWGDVGLSTRQWRSKHERQMTANRRKWGIKLCVCFCFFSLFIVWSGFEENSTKLVSEVWRSSCQSKRFSLFFRKFSPMHSFISARTFCMKIFLIESNFGNVKVLFSYCERGWCVRVQTQLRRPSHWETATVNSKNGKELRFSLDL